MAESSTKRRGRPPLSEEEKARRAAESAAKKAAEKETPAKPKTAAKPKAAAKSKLRNPSKPEELKGKVDMKHPTRMILPNHQIVDVVNRDSEIVKGVMDTFSSYVDDLLAKNPYDLTRSDLRQLIQFYLLVEKNSTAFGNRTMIKLTMEDENGNINTYLAEDDDAFIKHIQQGHKVIDLSYIKKNNVTEASGTLYILSAMNRMLKNTITTILDKYTAIHPLGRYMRQFRQVGPLTAAILIAYFDIENYPRVTQWWAYAGLDPTRKKRKGEKANWNAQLRMLLWRCVDKFNYVKDGSYDPEDPAYYAVQFYHKRKAEELARNDKGMYRDIAREQWESYLSKGKTLNEEEEAEFRAAASFWKEGKLNPGHIQQRALRYATKRLVSMAYEYMYCLKYGKLPEDYYPIVKLPEHTHYEASPLMAEALEYGRQHLDIAFR